MGQYYKEPDYSCCQCLYPMIADGFITKSNPECLRTLSGYQIHWGQKGNLSLQGMEFFKNTLFSLINDQSEEMLELLINLGVRTKVNEIKNIGLINWDNIYDSSIKKVILDTPRPHEFIPASRISMNISGFSARKLCAFKYSKPSVFLYDLAEVVKTALPCNRDSYCWVLLLESKIVTVDFLVRHKISVTMLSKIVDMVGSQLKSDIMIKVSKKTRRALLKRNPHLTKYCQFKMVEEEDDDELLISAIEECPALIKSINAHHKERMKACDIYKERIARLEKMSKERCLHSSNPPLLSKKSQLKRVFEFDLHRLKIDEDNNEDSDEKVVMEGKRKDFCSYCQNDNFFQDSATPLRGGLDQSFMEDIDSCTLSQEQIDSIYRLKSKKSNGVYLAVEKQLLRHPRHFEKLIWHQPQLAVLVAHEIKYIPDFFYKEVKKANILLSHFDDSCCSKESINGLIKYVDEYRSSLEDLKIIDLNSNELVDFTSENIAANLMKSQNPLERRVVNPFLYGLATLNQIRILIHLPRMEVGKRLMSFLSSNIDTVSSPADFVEMDSLPEKNIYVYGGRSFLDKSEGKYTYYKLLKKDEKVSDFCIESCVHKFWDENKGLWNELDLKSQMPEAGFLAKVKCSESVDSFIQMNLDESCEVLNIDGIDYYIVYVFKMNSDEYAYYSDEHDIPEYGSEAGIEGLQRTLFDLARLHSAGILYPSTLGVFHDPLDNRAWQAFHSLVGQNNVKEKSCYLMPGVISLPLDLIVRRSDSGLSGLRDWGDLEFIYRSHFTKKTYDFCATAPPHFVEKLALYENVARDLIMAILIYIKHMVASSRCDYLNDEHVSNMGMFIVNILEDYYNAFFDGEKKLFEIFKIGKEDVVQWSHYTAMEICYWASPQVFPYDPAFDVSDGMSKHLNIDRNLSILLYADHFDDSTGRLKFPDNFSFPTGEGVLIGPANYTFPFVYYMKGITLLCCAIALELEIQSSKISSDD